MHKPSMPCVKTCNNKKQIRELPEVRLEMKAETKMSRSSEELRLHPVKNGEPVRCERMGLTSADTLGKRGFMELKPGAGRPVPMRTDEQETIEASLGTWR